MSTVRISKFSNPETGGKRVQFRSLDRTTTVEWPGYTTVTHKQVWRDVGTLMDEVENHVKEQPTNRWKQKLIDAQRAAAQAKRADA